MMGLWNVDKHKAQILRSNYKNKNMQKKNNLQLHNIAAETMRKLHKLEPLNACKRLKIRGFFNVEDRDYLVLSSREGLETLLFLHL